MRRAVILAILCSGCGSPEGLSLPEDAGIDADTCGIVDCWDELYCRDGVVTRIYETDRACEDYGGVCPVTETSCQLGCDLDGVGYFEDPETELEPVRLCAETPAAIAGDTCNDATLCLPTRAAVQPDGTVTQTYLTCDAGTCVETAPPVIEGWLEPCDGVTEPPSPDFVGLDELCLIQHVSATSCLQTGRTVNCRGDWECPAGATCDDAIPGTPAYGGAFCRPGPRGAPIDLGC